MNWSGEFLSKSNVKETTYGQEYTKNAFGKWIAPINFKKLFEQVTIHQQDTYTKN